MQVRTFVVVALSSALAGVALGAGDTGAGIADVRVDRTSMRKVKTGASDRMRGGVVTVVDEEPVLASTESSAPLPGQAAVAQPAVVGCDFGGFPDRDQVGMAYAGGQSASGISKQNFGVAFSGAAILNSFNGSGAPNPGVVYTPGTGVGRIVVSFTQFNALTVEFTYSSKVTLQVTAYASDDATGTPMATYPIGPNVAVSGGFISWSQFNQNVPAGTRSLAIQGNANYWGLDSFVAGGQITGGAVAEYYQSAGCGGGSGTGWAGTLAAIGQPSISLGNLNSLDGIRVLFINNYSNCGADPMIQNAVGLRNFVNAGGILVVHDRWGFPGSWVPGASGLSATGQIFGTNVDRGPEASSFADGPYGVISNSDLDGGRYSTHGYMCSSLPADTQVVLTNGSCAVSIAYRYGAGWVYYSTIPLDFYQAGRGDSQPRENMNRYAKNVAVSMIARSAQPALKLTASAGACNPIGSIVEVNATLENCGPVVAGQMLLSWDPAKLSLASTSSGDAPFSVVATVNQGAGMATVLASVEPGSPAVPVFSKIIARLNFTVVGGACDGVGNEVGFADIAPLETEFTDGVGGSVRPVLSGSAGFVVDDGAPVLSNVPADVSVQAYAGENGFALVTLGTPTATDACAPSLTATGVRSDGQALGAAWPSGTTTVTWSAVDPCGNTTTATTRVTVDPTNTMDLAANFVAPFGFSDPYGGGGGATRTLTVSARGTAGSVSRTPTVSVGRDGMARFSINDLPVDTYGCVTIEHAPNSLRARVTVSDTGSAWTAQDATLVLGDIINDEVIDVLDWGAYIVRNPNADLNADGIISSTDGDIILANFGRQGDLVCGSSLMGPRDPVRAISVAELVEQGLADLASADLNGDGWLDQADMDFVR